VGEKIGHIFGRRLTAKKGILLPVGAVERLLNSTKGD